MLFSWRKDSDYASNRQIYTKFSDCNRQIHKEFSGLVFVFKKLVFVFKKNLWSSAYICGQKEYYP